jgi:YHS domain-containing protein
MMTDPVCGMKLEPEKAYSKLQYEGYVFYFCSQRCEEEFKKNPKKYIAKIGKEPKEEHCH